MWSVCITVITVFFKLCMSKEIISTLLSQTKTLLLILFYQTHWYAYFCYSWNLNCKSLNYNWLYMYMLQVKFDFRLILIQQPRLILNFLCFLALIHEYEQLFSPINNWNVDIMYSNCKNYVKLFLVHKTLPFNCEKCILSVL